MNRDFTYKAYKQILEEFRKNHYTFLTLENYVLFKKLPDKYVILRHDVDRNPKNSLRTAVIEKEFGIKASYYFRIGKESNVPEIIRQIAALGHEIGYHYEDLATAKGDYEKALENFEKNLDYFRKFYPVRTMCMHGSPLSKWDNKNLWERYDYKKYGIIAEPYFDLNFDEIFYITDASRLWNNRTVTRRDKVITKFDITINSSFDIISLLDSKKLPDKIMLNTHPQNWNGNNLLWYKSLLWQSIKNFIKRIINVYGKL